MKKFIQRLQAGVRNRLNEVGVSQTRSRLAQLQTLPFFDELFVGNKSHYYIKWKSPDNRIYSHGTITITVTRNGRLAGLISFDVIGNFVIVIRQMQAARKANFFDGQTTPQAYLLECAEQIAKTIGFKILRVETAKNVIEEMYSWGKKTPADRDQDSIRRIYDHAKERGYAEKYFWPLGRTLYVKNLSE